MTAPPRSLKDDWRFRRLEILHAQSVLDSADESAGSHAQSEATAFALSLKWAMDALLAVEGRDKKNDSCAELAAGGNDTSVVQTPQLSHDVPSPRPEDLCVSPENGPDYAPEQFSGGVIHVRVRGGVLMFSFAGGGQIYVSNPVVFMAPERH